MRRFFQFRLRTLIVATIVFAMFFAFIGMHVHARNAEVRLCNEIGAVVEGDVFLDYLDFG